MRLVVDTNILVSALLASTSRPAQLIVLWRQGRFELLTAAEQLDDARRKTETQQVSQSKYVIAYPSTKATGRCCPIEVLDTRRSYAAFSNANRLGAVRARSRPA